MFVRSLRKTEAEDTKYEKVSTESTKTFGSFLEIQQALTCLLINW